MPLLAPLPLQFLLVLPVLLVLVATACKKKAIGCLEGYTSQIYWRVLFFRFLVECFYEIFLAAFMNSYNMRIETFGDWINTLLTVITLIVCFNLPLAVIILF